MIIGIHPDQIGQESYSRKWTEFLTAREVHVRPLDLLAPDALRQVAGCSGVMWRWEHTPQHRLAARTVLQVIEHDLHIPVFPNARTSWHFDDKTAQSYLLSVLGAPVPRSWLFWSEAEALRWMGKAEFPLVFKLASGAGSSNVLLVGSPGEGVRLIRQMFRHGILPYSLNEHRRGRVPLSRTGIRNLMKSARDLFWFGCAGRFPHIDRVYWRVERGYAYFQEFLPDNEFDTRVSVIGDRAFAFRRFNRPGDFRASGSGRLEVDPAGIDLACVMTAFALSAKGRFQCMAYDFLRDRQKKPVVVEMSYGFADWAVESCPGHWDPKLNWHAGRLWPEAAQVEDFLKEAAGVS
jgi:hypothetical protein